MSIYQMSIFRMPKVVARRLEKVQRDFLWGGGNMEGKIHLVKWEVVCTDKDKGGLGLRKLAMLNKALLGKWIWRYACDKDNLWKQVIKVKYGQEGLVGGQRRLMGAVGVGVWKEIWKESEWCWGNMIFRVGKGNTIKFWQMCGVQSQRCPTVFPHLLWYGCSKEDQSSGQGNWNLNFLRDFNDWELDLVGDFLHILRGHKPHWGRLSPVEERKKWSVSRSRKLIVCWQKSDDTGFPSRSIWVARMPTKSCIFLVRGDVGEGAYFG
ncbi:putative ribonuclease H protein [Vitis vinifera]|uniref:Putative ribonuclease H protein n=1 Tax=Vitis vinifera TaxID=29760 RepID=A0A438CS83_VITVI|nr:putative ribonuclease H protein [Vitis vinifera]